MDLSDIRAVERLNIGPDERLAVYVDGDVDQEMAQRLVAHVAKWADIAPERVAVFAHGIELKILTPETL
jgi:broad specificity phosphatase PhoE